MARPGLWDELEKYDLLTKARVIVMGDGADADKAGRVETLLKGKGSEFRVTPRSVFIVRHKMEGRPEGDTIPSKDFSPVKPSPAKGKKRRNAENGKKPLHPHDGRRGNRPPPPPNRGSFKPGNVAAVTTGETYNPFLRVLLPGEDMQRINAEKPADELEAIERSIQLYAERLKLQLARLAKLERQKKSTVNVEFSYTRQEGDGALMGTGRIGQVKRRSLDEEIRRQHQIIDRTQKQYDAAVEKRHKMLQDGEGKRKRGIADVLAEMDGAEDGDDD